MSGETADVEDQGVNVQANADANANRVGEETKNQVKLEEVDPGTGGSGTDTEVALLSVPNRTRRGKAASNTRVLRSRG
jgi:hypothetical protein